MTLIKESLFLYSNALKLELSFNSDIHGGFSGALILLGF